MTKYYTIRTNSTNSLDSEVEKLIQDGWKLYGNMIAVPDFSKSVSVIYFFQTMVK